MQAQVLAIPIIYTPGYGIHLLCSKPSSISERSSYLEALITVFILFRGRFTTGEDTSLRSLIDQFLNAESKLQQVSNLSGNVSTGGLGEPKFNIDLSAFTGPWGR